MVKKSRQRVESIVTHGTSELTNSNYFEAEYSGTSLHSQQVDEGLEFLQGLLEGMELTPAVKYKSFFLEAEITALAILEKEYLKSQ